MPADLRIDGIAGGAGVFADDGALLAQQPIEQAALAHIGAADDGHAHLILIITLAQGQAGQAAQALGNGIEQIANTQAVDGADRVHLAQAQRIRVQRQLALLIRIDLIGGNEHGHLRPPQYGHDFFISAGQSIDAIDDENDAIRLLGGIQRLRANLRNE